AVLAGQHDHRGGFEFAVVLDQSAGLVAIEARHHDVNEDNVRSGVGDLGKGIKAVGCGDHCTTGFLQERFSRATYGFTVINHHDLQTFEIHLHTVMTFSLHR